MRLDAFEDLAHRDWDTGAGGTVRFAVVGLGGFARNVALPALADADYCEATALVTGSPDVGERVAADVGTEAVLPYDEYAGGEAASAYDAVYVATPNALHPDHAVAAAELGKDVLCEKPLAATVEGAARIVEACDDAGVRLMTAYRMQAHPVVRRMRAFVEGGGIGDPVQLHGGFVFPVLSGSRGPDHWRLDPDLAGGGALVDVGVYPLNTARYLLDGEPTAVQAFSTGEGPFEAVDERVAFDLRFGERTTASFTASFSGHADSRLSVVGEAGRLSLANAFSPGAERRLVVETADSRATFDCPVVDEVREEFDYFAHAALTGGEIEPDGADGLRDVELMARTYEAAASGGRVTL